MEGILKTIIFILGGIVVFALVILLLPILVLLYIFLPKRPAINWFNTFAQQARTRGARQSEAENTAAGYSNEIPASEDVIDISASEINDKNSK